MQKADIETFCPANRQEWRQWLSEHHMVKSSVWLIYYKKASGVPTISYQEALEEALCFGWIDSTKKKLDDNRFVQYFCKRKPGSVWSKINKAKVQMLTDEGKMMPAGFACIETARLNGSWTVLDEAEELKIPEDLEKAFVANSGSKAYFLSLRKSARKAILHWLVLAKRPETRQKRVAEIAASAAQKLLPAPFR